MAKEYKLAALVFGIVAVGSFLARTFGWYWQYWFTDVILHTISGTMFGFIWLGYVRKEEFKSKWVLLFSTITFAVFGSYLWEMWELWGSTLAPWFPTRYVPELGDSLWDMACGAVGSVFAWANAYTSRSGSRRA